MKLTKANKDQIAENLAIKSVCCYSKAAPVILRLAARKAQKELAKAKEATLSAKKQTWKI